MSRNFALPGRSPVHACNYAVATSHPLGTASAMKILREGGNAVDAALAASATLCVVEPHMTGIGGDCFVIICEPDGSLHGLNGSGRSASSASLDWFIDNGYSKIPIASPHAVTTPGAVRAWETLHQKFGRTDFVRLFADAIHLAEGGFAVAPRVAWDWAKHVEKLSAHEGGAKHFLFDGKPPVEGQRIELPALAETLRLIATAGADEFYNGRSGEEIAATVQKAGGFLTHEDIVKVSSRWVEPISTQYGDHVLHELPPNGQGLAALMLVKLLREIGPAKELSGIERAHLEAEAGRIAYAARDAYIADPETMNHSVEELLSQDHIAKLAALYDPDKRNNSIALPDPSGSDTVYLTVVDRDGMAVSFINSIFSGFGTGIVTPQTGITLQNRGTGFNLIEGHPNSIGPSKLPFHTIIPAMVTRSGRTTHSFGVMGGSYQAMGHSHVLLNMLEYGMNPQQALDNPRIFWDEAGALALEDGVPEKVRAGLSEKGHPVTPGALHGGGQIIEINHSSGTLIAASDYRKDGHASGF